MNETTSESRVGSPTHAVRSEPYRQPTVEVISLDCEISAYAPDDGDVPLF